ncbi:pro-resilin-like [Macrobrachium nipponense]|uniref:pro-resilin-like n=1 Tax=Macrobrachium nipponense TaxID=159736 RepID=UPI0030C80B63
MKVLFLFGLVALAAADKRPSTSYGPPTVSSFEGSFEGNSDESFEPAKYSFEFGVHDDSTSASFEHQESRDDDQTRGTYTVQLPDGRRQTVKYFVNGDSGYLAEVTYEGEARYPDSFESREDSTADSREFSAPRPTYSAPDSREFQSYSPPSSSYGVPV